MMAALLKASWMDGCGVFEQMIWKMLSTKSSDSTPVGWHAVISPVGRLVRVIAHSFLVAVTEK